MMHSAKWCLGSDTEGFLPYQNSYLVIPTGAL